MTIYDCFTYYNEEEILKIRLNELNQVVDYFVIIQGNQTFTGKPKKLFLDDVSWLDQFADKIIRINVSLDECNSTWEAEYTQRNASDQIAETASADDICIISDVDEIPNPAILASSKICYDLDTPIQLDVDQFFWNFNWLTPVHCNNGGRPVVCRVGDLENVTPQQIRSDSKIKRIPKAGWHFSFLMDYEDIINKIESFSHTEYNLDEFKDLEKIRYRIENGIDPFDRFPLKWQNIDKSYPKYIQENYSNGQTK